MYIVAFNGPPESGKDTLAEMLADHMDAQGVTLPVRVESLSLPLRHIAYAMVGRTYDESTYADFKREYFAQLDRDGRHLMIDASEQFLKPTYGIEVMAKLLLDRNKDFTGVLLLRDSGFQIEVDPLIRAVDRENCCVVRVIREGKSFEALNDSREFVQHPSGDRRMMVIANNGTLDDLRTEAGRIYGRLVNQYGWKM